MVELINDLEAIFGATCAKQFLVLNAESVKNLFTY